MTIPERVKDILEEIANDTDCTCPSSPEDTRGMPCPVCLATEALRIIAEGGEKISPEEPPGISLEDFSIRYTLSDAHWQWVESLCEKMYKEAFVHGFKHGAEYKNKP